MIINESLVNDLPRDSIFDDLMYVSNFLPNILPDLTEQHGLPDECLFDQSSVELTSSSAFMFY
jgi:hypothetical protein